MPLPSPSTFARAVAPAIMVLACAQPPLPALPSGVHLTKPHPGRYAMLLASEQRGGCSMSHFYSTSRASLVLTLGEDGAARGCRGRRWTSTVASNEVYAANGEKEGDPHPDTMDLVEQQGMRGTWQTSGDVLHVDLALDDSICPPKRNDASREPRPWSLECVAIAPSAGSVEPAFSALACRLVGLATEPGSGAYPHDVGYTVAEPFLFFGRDTIFLAPEPGVAIEEHAYGGLSPEGQRTWTRPAAPIAFDAWSR